MSLVDRFFGKRGHQGGSQANGDQMAMDRERSQRLGGTPTAQSAEERDSVRAHMEAELDAQRARRLQT